MSQRPVLILLTALAALFVAPSLSALPAPTDNGGDPVTAETCLDCHEDQVHAFARTPHSLLDSGEWDLPEGATYSCATCHGDATAHLDEGGGTGNIIALGAEDSASGRTAACQDCHAGSHPRFSATSHAKAGLDCLSCHSVHASAPEGTALLTAASGAAELKRLDAASATCFDCHDAVFAQFEFNERHRLQEGIIGCTDCHNPHEPQSRLRLASVNQDGCVSCHEDKGGPFVFEHGSSRVEGCTACHSPHGSPNRHMLAFQQPGETCFACHAIVPQFHVGFNPFAPPRFDGTTNCTNCHSAIHGSNIDPYFLQ